MAMCAMRWLFSCFCVCMRVLVCACVYVRVWVCMCACVRMSACVCVVASDGTCTLDLSLIVAYPCQIMGGLKGGGTEDSDPRP